jgi:hypothetical protein
MNECGVAAEPQHHLLGSLHGNVSFNASKIVRSLTSAQVGGTLELVAGASQSATTIASGGIFGIGAGATLSGFQVNGCVIVEGASGGIITHTTVKNVSRRT